MHLQLVRKYGSGIQDGYQFHIACGSKHPHRENNKYVGIKNQRPGRKEADQNQGGDRKSKNGLSNDPENSKSLSSLVIIKSNVGTEMEILFNFDRDVVGITEDEKLLNFLEEDGGRGLGS